jgi:hypothetical protein
VKSLAVGSCYSHCYLSLQTRKVKNINPYDYRLQVRVSLQTIMSKASKAPIIEHYIGMKLSESQYSVLQAISQVKAMTIDDYCQWALRQGLERDIELHFGDRTKDRLLQDLQGESNA